VVSFGKIFIMTLNNSKSIINLKISRRASLIVYAAFLLLAFVARIIKFPLLGIGLTGWTIFFTASFLAIILIPLLLDYHYIFYSDEGDSIIIRYYSTGLLEGKKNSIEIDKRNFSGFTLEKKFFGLNQSITLYQRHKKGVAKYPPVFINAMKQADRIKMLKSLNSYAPRVKNKTTDDMS
jgi:hypothetical protein